MGIPKLASRMRSYGSVEFIGRKGESRDDFAVIDGPSLAHSLLQQDPKDVLGSAGGIMPQYSYSALGRRAIEWLDDLQNYGFTVEAIYFDGTLPEHKKTVRIERLQAYIDKLVVFKAVHDDLDKAARNSRSKISSEQTEGRIEMARRSLPPPPFLVFAVVEALKNSDYATRTFLVDGEADELCAAKALHLSLGGKHPQITIFTNDSDLIVYGLPERARVVQINEMSYDEDHAGKSLAGLEFWPSRLRIGEGGETPRDLVRPAYLMKLDSHLPFRNAVTNARKDYGPFSKDDFNVFMTAYDLASAEESLNALEHGVQTQADSPCFLDSRVSEVLLKAVQERDRIRKTKAWYATRDVRILEQTKADLANGWPGSGHSGKEKPGPIEGAEIASNFDAKDFAYDQEEEDLRPADLDVFLPVLFEDPSRSTAWKAGSRVRDAAMHVTTLLCGTSAVVHEYKRSGQRVREVACQQMSAGLCNQRLRLWTDDWSSELERHSNRVDSWRWRLLIVRLLLADMVYEEMALPNRSTVRSLVTGSPASTWDLTHLKAMIQAEYYSLRMLKQVLSFVSQAELHEESDSEMLGRTIRLLESLPDIIAFCDLLTNDGDDTPTEMSNAVGRLINDFGIADRLKSTSSSPKHGSRERKKRTVFERATNVFDLLEDVGDA